MTASKQLLWFYFRADVLFSCSQNWHDTFASTFFCRLGLFAAAWSAMLARGVLAGWLNQHFDAHMCASTWMFAVERKGLTLCKLHFILADW